MTSNGTVFCRGAIPTAFHCFPAGAVSRKMCSLEVCKLTMTPKSIGLGSRLLAGLRQALSKIENPHSAFDKKKFDCRSSSSASLTDFGPVSVTGSAFFVVALRNLISRAEAEAAKVLLQETQVVLSLDLSGAARAQGEGFHAKTLRCPKAFAHSGAFLLLLHSPAEHHPCFQTRKC